MRPTVKTSYPSDKALQVERQPLLTDVPRKGTRVMTERARSCIGSCQPGMDNDPKLELRAGSGTAIVSGK